MILLKTKLKVIFHGLTDVSAKDTSPTYVSDHAIAMKAFMSRKDISDEENGKKTFREILHENGNFLLRCVYYYNIT